MSKIITVIGGISSGKSGFATNIALDIGKKRAYIATAEITDADMKLKIQKHIDSRKDDFCTIENFDSIDFVIKENKNVYDVIMIDCITNMLNNIMYHRNIDFETCDNIIFEDFSKEVKKYVQRIIDSMSKTNFVIVTNEMGLGGVSANRYTRRFVQLQGEINQMFCKASDEVYFVLSGIANKIK